MKTATTNTVLVIATLAVAAIASGCAGPQMPAAHWVGDLALEVPAETSNGTVDVVITGSDMSHPAYAQLEVEDGVARGVVPDVSAGTGRVVLLSTQTADGRRCASELRTNVARSDTTTVASDGLQCEALHEAAPVAVAVSDFPPIL